MSKRKYDFSIEGYQGMDYFCVAESFDEALKIAKQKAAQLKREEGFKEAPEVESISLERGDLVEAEE